MAEAFELPESFWAKVDRRSDDECWEWQGARDQKEYGLVRFQGPVVRAPRVVLMSLGNDMTGKDARHHCDNPPCCNPRHLAQGTRLDNVHDCIERGRRAIRRGTENNRARLSENEVLQIRQAYEALPKSLGGYSAKGEARKIARQFGIGYVHLNLIVNRKLWKHI